MIMKMYNRSYPMSHLPILGLPAQTIWKLAINRVIPKQTPLRCQGPVSVSRKKPPTSRKLQHIITRIGQLNQRHWIRSRRESSDRYRKSAELHSKCLLSFIRMKPDQLISRYSYSENSFFSRRIPYINSLGAARTLIKNRTLNSRSFIMFLSANLRLQSFLANRISLLSTGICQDLCRQFL